MIRKTKSGEVFPFPRGGFSHFLLAELQGGSAGAATMMELSQSFFAPIPAPGSLLLLGTALLAVMAGGPWNRRDGAQPRRDPRNASVAAASSDGPAALARMTTA